MPMTLMYLIRSLFVVLFGIFPIVRSQDDSVFTNPSRQKDRNWALGDTKVVSWKTKVPVFNVSLWQQNEVEDSATSQGIVYSQIRETDEVKEFSWVVQVYGADLSFSNVFFFWVNRDGSDSFTSPYFNITQPKTTTTSATDSPSTTGVDASANTVDTSATNTVDTSATDTSATNAVNLTPPKSSSTYAPDSTEEPTSGLQSTEKIALGVGIGVGVPIIGALFALVWLKMRQSSNTANQTAGPSETIPLAKPVMYAQNRPPTPPKEVKGSEPKDYYAPPPNEMKGTDPRDFSAELPAQ